MVDSDLSFSARQRFQALEERVDALEGKDKEKDNKSEEQPKDQAKEEHEASGAEGEQTRRRRA